MRCEDRGPGALIDVLTPSLFLQLIGDWTTHHENRMAAALQSGRAARASLATTGADSSQLESLVSKQTEHQPFERIQPNTPPLRSPVSPPTQGANLASQRQQDRREKRLLIGRRWLEASGAVKRRIEEEAKGNSYQSYLARVGTVPQDEAVHRELRKAGETVKRFDFQGLRVPILKATVKETESLSRGTKAAMTRMLQGLCMRLYLEHTEHRGGPIDGLRYLVVILLAHAEETEAFWLLVMTVEELNATVCLGDGPAEFSGFVIESAVLQSLVKDSFPQLAKVASTTRQRQGNLWRWP